MSVNDFFVGEIATELLKLLVQVSLKASMCKANADQLIEMIDGILPTIQEIKYTGVELPPHRQFQIDAFSRTLVRGKELADKVLKTGRWNFPRNLHLARKMEKLEKTVYQFVNGPLLVHIYADIHHIRFDSAKHFDGMDHRLDRIEERLASMKIGGGGWVQDAMKRAEVGIEMEMEGNLGNFGIGFELGKSKVKEMLLNGNGGVVGITGIAGSGKTTLATEMCRDGDVKSYFNNKILMETVSQSPNLEQLRSKIWCFLSGYEAMNSTELPQWNFQFEGRFESRTLVILDDVWTHAALEQLTFRVPGCTTLVVSRSRLTKPDSTYQVELLRDDEAMSLFCLSAFGQKSVPPSSCENLVKQIVDECKGLPLALKVIGASLRDQPEKYWEGARKKLSKGESICESHENNLLERIAISVECLPENIKECFLDLGSFPEDKKIPLDILINMWVEIHDIHEAEAFKFLVDLSDKNLLTLGKDSRLGAMYSSYYDIFVTQHDVLRDLALHLSNRGKLTQRKRLLMPKREIGLPKDWERNADQPFNAQIVSVQTGEMNEMDWFPMEFPKAEVLILNFSSNKFFLPPFMDRMPKLRALIVINNSPTHATLHDFSVFSNLANLRSLWLEKVHVPQLSNTTVPLKNLSKLSLILCKINNSFDQSTIDLTHIFPCLSDLTIDHCDDLVDLPSSICGMNSLNSLSITNCRSLAGLPDNLSDLKSLEILRLYACPKLKTIPGRICELFSLKYIDVSQCVNLNSLPEEIGNLGMLEKIDMRECSVWAVPSSAASCKSLRHVICDEEIAWLWKGVGEVMPGFHVQAAERCFSLGWLDE